MKKLVAAYLAYPTLANARRLVSYIAKHPTCFSTMDALELGLLTAAKFQRRHRIYYGHHFRWHEFVGGSPADMEGIVR